MPLTMGNMSDNDIEELLRLVRQIADFRLYDTEMPDDVDHGGDAVGCMNYLIRQAREIIGN